MNGDRPILNHPKVRLTLREEPSHRQGLNLPILSVTPEMGIPETGLQSKAKSHPKFPRLSSDLLRYLGGILISGCSILSIADLSIALPPPEDTPEEILRTEIILEARSPINGEPLTPAEYILLQENLAPDPDPQLSPEVRRLIRLLYLRRAIRRIFPFLIP
jgi:hypothetical protein